MKITAPTASGPAVTLVLVAWAFLPMEHLPTFDAVKLAVLVPAALWLTFRAWRREEPGTGR